MRSGEFRGLRLLKGKSDSQRTRSKREKTGGTGVHGEPLLQTHLPRALNPAADPARWGRGRFGWGR